MNPHHRTFLDTLWPDRDDNPWRQSASLAFRDGFSTALGQAQGRLDTLTTRERLRLAWAILQHDVAIRQSRDAAERERREEEYRREHSYRTAQVRHSAREAEGTGRRMFQSHL